MTTEAEFYNAARLTLAKLMSEAIAPENKPQSESFLKRVPKDLKNLKIPISDEVIEVLGLQPEDIVRITIELEKPKQTAPEFRTALQISTNITPGAMFTPQFTIPFNEPTDDSKTATTRKTESGV